MKKLITITTTIHKGGVLTEFLDFKKRRVASYDKVLTKHKNQTTSYKSQIMHLSKRTEDKNAIRS